MTRFRQNFTAPMTRRKDAIGLIAAAALAGSGGALAGDFSVGVGAGVDRGRVDCVVSFPCDSNGAHWKLFAGYQVTETADVQAVWFDAGRFKGGDTSPLGTEFGGTFRVSGFGLSGGYRWEFAPSWSLAGRAGLTSLRTRFDYADAAFGSASKTTTQPLLGVGLAYAITPTVRLSLDYDVTRFKVHTSRGPLQMLGLAVQYSI